ncbi:Methyltransferase type 11 [uncultured Caudovirales phage]|uniref:Methyltransferase type 11 n=3 Tax=uncultured Caudovirales phage TaxID=2100421 RepID=A0A6J5QBN1_9CAUD|nr:Methyltransferase type 11 [uncultured Caudovirales phage]CAB4181503.1 Methyltransferase type 11 [uncultured Caudovirales phage]CAB4198745.1 Methyltransferase type 11 [uncultured Caudovirales phage]CAB4210570.1 Methyltransferase type 11 [uncultured Caudovirales phage]
MKLHLACGSVYLKDYINIDIKGELVKDNPQLVEENTTTLDNYFKKSYVKRILGHNARGRIVVDILSDVKKLPFEDDTVDEILTVNLVDHIRLQEIPTMFNEWHRILKSGGKLIIDVGDAIGNAKLLADAKTDDELEWALRLMYCHSRDEFDSHRWGYTANYLTNVLQKYGFNYLWDKTDYIEHVYPAFQLCVEAVK